MKPKRGACCTLKQVFARLTLGTMGWRVIEALLKDLGAEVIERKGSRVGVYLFGEVRIFHRPHPSPDADKGVVTSIRFWLKENGREQ